MKHMNKDEQIKDVWHNAASGAVLASFTYDSLNRAQDVIFGSGAKNTYTYDSAIDRISRWEVKPVGAVAITNDIGGGGGGDAENNSQTVSKTYPTIEQAIKCAFWNMLNDLRNNNQGTKLEDLLHTSRTEWGGRLYTDGKGGYAHSNYQSWSIDTSNGAWASTQVPKGMTVVGNYHTHNLLAYNGGGGWTFSNADLNRRTHGYETSLSSPYYSSIVTPDRYGSALIGMYPPNVNVSPSVSPKYSEIKINGGGC